MLLECPWGPPYHRLVPDDGHPLLDPVDALRDQGEVVLAHRLLGSAVGTVAAARDLQVSADEDENEAGLRPKLKWKGQSRPQTTQAQTQSPERCWGLGAGPPVVVRE